MKNITAPVLPVSIISLRHALRADDTSPDKRVQLHCDLAHQYARAGLAKEGLATVKEAIELIQDQQLKQGKSEALNAAAMCHFFRGDHLMAIACGIDAYKGFVLDNNNAGMGHALTTVAASCNDIDAHDLAEEAFRGCIRIAENIQDYFLLARSQNAYGVLLGDIGRFEEADAMFLAAHENLLLSDQSGHIPKVITNRGNLHRKRAEKLIREGNHDLAKEHIRQGIVLVRKGLETASEADNPYECADKTRSLGEYHFLLGEFELAQQNIEKALALGRALDHPHLITESMLFFARIVNAQSDFQRGKEILRQALDYAKQKEMKIMLPRLHEELAGVLTKLGNVEEAAHHTNAAQQWDQNTRLNNVEVEREARVMWAMHFSQHPLIASLSPP